jgi:hypothetical protein
VDNGGALKTTGAVLKHTSGVQCQVIKIRGRTDGTYDGDGLIGRHDVSEAEGDEALGLSDHSIKAYIRSLKMADKYVRL